MKYIIAIMGPSQSGKSKVIEKIMSNKCDGFDPILIAKETTRDYRAEELLALKAGKSIDVVKVDSFTADLIYQTYGKRTGTKIDDLITKTNEGKTPVVIINDIIALKKLKRECAKRDSDVCVISMFLFRRIPVKQEFFDESLKRGNVPEKETEQRYDKAKTVYRIFIENIDAFDYVLLNAIHYSDTEFMSSDTIIDRQIRSIRDNIILKNKRPFERKNKTKPVLYIISGNAASGKDELIKATMDLGKLYADAIPKYTSRAQGSDDGDEMICKYIFDDNCQINDKKSTEILNNKEEVPSGYKLNSKYFEMLNDRQENKEKYMSYTANRKYEYVFNVEQIKDGLEKKGRSQVLVLSNLDVINKLIDKFGEQVIVTYCHSQIDEKEFLAKSKGTAIDDKIAKFQEQLMNFANNFILYRHVIIYAENEMGHQSDGRQEELIDQLFRLFNAYEENTI